MTLTRLSDARLAFLLVSEDNVLTLASLHIERSRVPTSLAQEKLRRTSPHAHVKLELEKHSFLLGVGVQKLEPLYVFDFLEPFRQLSDMKMNASPPCMVQMTKS